MVSLLEKRPYNKLREDDETGVILSSSLKDEEMQFLSQSSEELPPRSQLNLLLTVITSVWCSILFGYNTGVISTALLKIDKEIPMNAFYKSTLVSIILFGAMGGSVLTAVVIGMLFMLLLFTSFIFI